MLTQEQSARTQRVDELISSAARSEDVGAKAVELIFGGWRSQILHAAVKLGVFDAISNASKNAQTAAGDRLSGSKLRSPAAVCAFLEAFENRIKNAQLNCSMQNLTSPSPEDKLNGLRADVL